MTTLSELRPCILDGHIATRQISDLAMPEFVDFREGEFYYEYEDNERESGMAIERFATFDACLERIGAIDTMGGADPDDPSGEMWDLLELTLEQEAEAILRWGMPDS